MKPISKVGDESGVAVLTVLLAMTLVLILGGALFLVAQVSLERSVAATDASRALDTAEAGLQTSADTLVGSFSAGSSGVISGTMGDGSEYDVYWEADTALPWFTLTSTGYYPTKADTRGVRTVKAEVFTLNPWDFQYAGGMTGATVNGNVWVDGPFYVNDELELSGTAGVHTGPLIIYDTTAPGDGDLILDSASADIGSAGNPVPLFIDGEVVRLQNGSYYADPVYSWAPELEFPDLTQTQLTYYRADNSASPWLADVERPTAVLDVDSGQITPDNDTNLVLGRNIKIGTNQNASQAEIDAALLDKADNPNDLNNPRVSITKSGNTITMAFDNTGDVHPILFVDGDVTFGDNQTTVRYSGIGTVVASGNIAIEGNLVPAGSTTSSDPATTTLNGFPQTNALGLITRNNIHYEGKNSEWLAAALYSGNVASFAKQGNFKGSVVTRNLDLGTNVPHLYTQPGFSTKLPPKMPGAEARITSIIGWTELAPGAGTTTTTSP
ncbi:MAG: hypothetical protein Kow00129_07290 [Thermoleophilia bacterium]